MFRTGPSGRRASRRVLLIATPLVLLLGFLAADRAASVVAGNRISTELTCLSGSTPDLHMRSFPLLPRLITGHLGNVQAHLPLFITDEVTVTAVDIDAEGLALPQGEQGPLAFQQLTASFDVPFSLLPTTVEGFDVRYAKSTDGLLAVSTTAEISSVKVPVTVLTSVSLHDDRVVLTPEELRVFGVGQSLGLLGDWFTQVISVQELPPLPTDLTYQGLSLADTGLRVQIGGRDLLLENPGPIECRG